MVTLGGFGLLLLLLVFFAVLSFASLTTAAGAILVLMGLVYLGLLVLGLVLFLMLPFFESVSQGLLCAFVPFYSLYYVITRWDSMKRPFIHLLCVNAAPIVLAVVLPAIHAARQAAERARARQQPPAAENEVATADTEPPPLAPAPNPNPGPASASPLPLSPAPANGIVVELSVSGVNDYKSGHALGQKLGLRISTMAREVGHGVVNTQVGRRGDLVTFTITPIRDPQAFADRINFGTVTEVRGRSIRVAVTPESAAALPDVAPSPPRPDAGPAPAPAPRPIGPRRVPRRPAIGGPRGR
jgi:hypothetical protein